MPIALVWLLQAKVDTVSVVGAGSRFLDTLVANWQLTGAVLFAAWYLGRLTRAIDEMAKTIADGFKSVHARQGRTEITVDKHETRLSRQEGKTELLAKHLDINP